MQVLLTRPAADSLKTAERLRDHHIQSIIQPVFEVAFLQPDLPSLEHCQAIIATSQHSVTAFAGLSNERDLPIYCVGNHTAETARQAGFTDVYSADGDKHDLRDLVRQALNPNNGFLLRLAGYTHRDTLVEELSLAQFTLRSVQLYAVQEIDHLNADTIQALNDATLDGVLFFSPKTASRFYKLVAKQGLSASCRSLTAWCISENAARVLDGLSFKEIAIAERPTQKALLELICPT